LDTLAGYVTKLNAIVAESWGRSGCGTDVKESWSAVTETGIWT